MKRKPRQWNENCEPDMKLPEGRTCGDCSHFQRCEKLIGSIKEDSICDWSPNKFQLSFRVKAGELLKQSVYEKVAHEYKENPLPEPVIDAKTQRRIDEANAVLHKPQPKSGGTYNDWEI